MDRWMVDGWSMDRWMVDGWSMDRTRRPSAYADLIELVAAPTRQKRGWLQKMDGRWMVDGSMDGRWMVDGSMDGRWMVDGSNA